MLAHSQRGEGPTAVLLLHGFLGSGRNLGALVRQWHRQDPTIRFVQADLLGHGRSPALSPDADLFTQGEAALELARELELPEPYRVVGHSIGGRVALTMRELAPTAVASIDLLDIAPGPTRGMPSTHIAEILLDAPDEASDRETFGRYFREHETTRELTEWLLMNIERTQDGFRWRIDRAALVGFHEHTSDTDLWSVAERHGSALRCLRGGASVYVSERDVRRYEEIGVAVQTVPDAGHFIHVDATEAVVEALAGDGAAPGITSRP